jgi:Tfp pilus assembly protein PilO
MAAPAPDISWNWLQQFDVVRIIIMILLFLLGWFVKREFKSFEGKLDCISTKADAEEVKKTFKEAFHQIKNHDHKIKCNVPECKPETDGVIISDRRTGHNI